MSIALFGGGAVCTVKGGIGSGDVNNRESISIYRGLKTAGAVITSEDWIADYKNRYACKTSVNSIGDPTFKSSIIGISA